jgi:hypothetical protein
MKLVHGCGNCTATASKFESILKDENKETKCLVGPMQQRSKFKWGGEASAHNIIRQLHDGFPPQK